ncbi:hypothetical protein EG329_002421 [Mollisiaceae sp. DMI_Dod_QoI]|nr:hypothetical protein EG329_002421 [Helotiales sp. DMI_Dod_QoI]
MGKFYSLNLSRLLSAGHVSISEYPEESEEVSAAMPVATTTPEAISRLCRLSQFLPKLRTSDTKLQKDRDLPYLPRKRDPPPYVHHQHTSSQLPPTRAPPPAPLGASEQERDYNNGVDYTTKLRVDGLSSYMPPIPRQGNGGGYTDYDNGVGDVSPLSRMPPVPGQVNGLENESANYTNRLRKDRPSSHIPVTSRQENGEESQIEDYMRHSSRMQPNSHQEHRGGYSEGHTKRLSKHHSQSPPRALLNTHTPPPRAESPNLRTADHRRPRAKSLLPSQSQPDFSNFRSVSTPLNSRPNSTLDSSDGEGSMGNLKDIRRQSTAFIGSIFHSRPSSQDRSSEGLRPWVITSAGVQADYGLDYLLNAEKIPEMWDLGELADLYIYLYPRASGRGPQIKCGSVIIESSRTLKGLAQDSITGRARARSFDGRASLTIEDATRNLAVRNPGSPPYTPKISAQDPQSATDSSNESIRSFGSTLSGPRELHLYLPLGLADGPEQLKAKDNESLEERMAREMQEQRLIDARNLFAFLTGQPIVFTKNTPTPFHCFLTIANLLRQFGFSEHGGISYGPAVNFGFDFYLNILQIADVRESREKTLEGLILGEAMKSETLYNEAFAHAVGKYEALTTKESPLWDKVSKKTKQGIERGHLQLKGYQSYVEERLADFEFPSVFAGLAASTSTEESKLIKFKSWKSNFLGLRKAVISYYKHLHGSWPPKASSKKNSFVEGGLNRLVLKGLYTDLCDLYDFLVDRDNVTTRAAEASEMEIHDNRLTIVTLRKLLDEYDKSTTWRTPPMPLDVPHLPTIASIIPNFDRLDSKEQHKLSTKRKVKDNEVALIMTRGHNVRDGHEKYKTPFMDMYKKFELKEARGKNARELEEQRVGHWIFLYVVLQVLPLLISDAPGLRYTEGVEYFLSAMPPENMPWVEGAKSQMNLYQSADGTISRMPAHQVEFGINSIYSRSHCWEAANNWLLKDRTMPDIQEQGQLSPLSPPPGFAEPRPSSRGRVRSSSAGGLPRPRSTFSTADGLLAPRAPGSRLSSLSQRSSIALGLEQLPRFDGGEEFGVTSPALTTSALGGAAAAVNRTPPERDVTFDDILASMDVGDGGKKEKKKGKK